MASHLADLYLIWLGEWLLLWWTVIRDAMIAHRNFVLVMTLICDCHGTRIPSLFTGTLVFFLNGAELSLIPVISVNLINHWSMNWAQFKDPVSHMCLVGTVVASWSLTQEVAGSNPFNDKYFCYRIHWIQWKWSYLASLVFGKNCRKIRVNTSRPESKKWWHQAYAPIRKQYLWEGPSQHHIWW